MADLLHRVRSVRDHAYDVAWCESLPVLTRRLAGVLGERHALLVSTPTVAALYGRELHRALLERGRDVLFHELACSELDKNVEAVTGLCAIARELGMQRSSVFVSVGGGVCSDIVTVAASLVRRGLGHVRVPTTLLAQVDAGLGVKGGVNHGGKKNYLGCFHPPEAVLVCPRFLPSVSLRHLRAGMAEIFKVAAVGDPALLLSLENIGHELVEDRFEGRVEETRDLLWRAAQGLLNELAPNLFEDRTLVRSMDFGHTFSPLLEMRSRHALCHGEAVAIDMALSIALAVELGWLSPPDEERLLAILAVLGLPVDSPLLDVAFCRESIEESERHRGGRLNLFLPVGIGRVRCLYGSGPLSESVLEAALERARARALGSPADA